MKSLLPALLALPSFTLAQTYFQQQVDYTINVRLDDVGHFLYAQEEFVYSNNSSTTLDTLWMHLWPNAYRDRTTALCEQMDRLGDLSLHFATEEERGWIDSLDFRANDAKLSWGPHTRHPDIAWIKLPEPLPPNTSITISTPFRVRIPDGKFSRLGHTKQAYYITQWYPKPAVFDAQGWHAMPYLTLGEFYSEFGSFDVTITLPANYKVGATGELQNAEERAWMDSLAALPPSQQMQKELLPAEKRTLNAFPPSSTATKTIRYKQDRVHDFAWFADKRFLIRKSAVNLPRSGRSVTTWVMFTPKNRLVWEQGVTYVNEAVKHYSEWVGDYPYSACTAVDGTISAGGGMEYPMITVIGDTEEPMALDEVIAHEVGHNWFYGILGSNERDHAWMDEGMNSFVELRYMRERYPGQTSVVAQGIPKFILGDEVISHREVNELAYRLNARRNLDQRLSLTSDDFTPMNYGTCVYMKTALVMDHLFAYLGDETFDQCMHAYYDEWKFKHPQPEDMRKIFERESGKDLSWLFSQMVGTEHKIDPRSVELDEGILTYSTNTGAPFPITAWAGEDSLGTVWSNTAEVVWRTPSRKTRPIVDEDFVRRARASEPPSGKGTMPLPWPNVDRIRIDAGNRTMDIDRRNNEVRSDGLLKRIKLPAFEPLFGIERQDRKSIHYSPIFAWNGHDGFQAGLAFWNTTFPPQRTEWVIAPLYALGSERPVGGARIEHHFDRMRSGIFQNIHLGLSVRSSGTLNEDDAVGWYEKVSPYALFDLKRDPLSRHWQHRIGLRGVYVQNKVQYEEDDALLYTSASDEYYAELFYRAQDDRELHPSVVQPTFTATYDWLRASLELRQAFVYNARNKQLRLRAFAGSFLWKRDEDNGLSNGLQAWGLTWGPEDMLYEQAYLERGAAEGFPGRQFNKQQGAFKTPFAAGGSDTWIFSANMELDLPFSLPIAVFASAGVVPRRTITVDGSTESSVSYFEAGVGMPVIRDVLEIWFPFYVSENIIEEEEFAEREVSDRIRFVFALEKMDPTNLLRKIKP